MPPSFHIFEGHNAAEYFADLSVIVNETLSQQWSLDSLKRQLGNGRSFGIIATENGAPIGCALGTHNVDSADILLVATRPKFQRKGLGKELLTQFIALTEEKELPRILLEVATDNIPAQKLYTGCNFTHIDTRPQYYLRPNHNRVDALIMELELPIKPI
jgi:ribosomal-protein-alanine N-acetyltransferase